MTDAETTESQNTEVTVKELPAPVCEPAPLGLFGLAVAAFVLGCFEMGWGEGVSNADGDFDSNKALIIPWAIFLGATAQLIAGIMDYKRNNIFGATAFTTYSMLWYAVGLSLLFTQFIPGVNDAAKHDTDQYAAGLVAFLIFSLILTVASMLTNKVLFAILIFIDLALFTVAGHYLYEWDTEYGGFFLLVVSFLSFYGGGAVLINTMVGKPVIPMGKPVMTGDQLAAKLCSECKT